MALVGLQNIPLKLNDIGHNLQFFLGILHVRFLSRRVVVHSPFKHAFVAALANYVAYSILDAYRIVSQEELAHLMSLILTKEQSLLELLYGVLLFFNKSFENFIINLACFKHFVLLHDFLVVELGALKPFKCFSHFQCEIIILQANNFNQTILCVPLVLD